MTKIKIMRMVLENFKCHRLLKLDFDGRDATIYGDNATGKTSIYDALTWLLFGKDSAGNGEKNIEIKPLDSTGAVADHKAITSVEVELSASGETVTLKRTYREIWSTKRGFSQEVYDGNTSEYFVNGAPCKKYAFDDQVKALVPEDVFRLLTSVEYFPNTLAWQKRRAVLFDMAGTRTDREIMEGNEAFTPLLEGMGKLSLEDYRKKLTAEKKGFTGIKDETPARISECQKTVDNLCGIDFEGTRTTVVSLEEHQRQISAQMVELDHNTAADTKRMEIRECRLALDKLIMQNDAHRTQQLSRQPDINAIQKQIMKEQNRLTTAKTLRENSIASLPVFDKAIEQLRQEWTAVIGETFTGGNCPTCGQSLPFDQLQKATAEFETRKQRRLNEITETANLRKQAKVEAEKRIQEQTDEIQERENHLVELENQYQQAMLSKVEPTDMPGFAETATSIRSSIKDLEDQLQEILGGTDSERFRLKEELSKINRELSALREIIAKESVLQYARNRISEIREEAQNAAAALEAIDKMLFLTEEYTRFKARFVEDSINSLFAIARFRLFREQANGGLEERCDVVYDGVPYIGLNNGARINVGIDIINALSRHYGVTVPLFVDNAESVTHLQACGAQVIRLVVSECDKELRVV